MRASTLFGVMVLCGAMVAVLSYLSRDAVQEIREIRQAAKDSKAAPPATKTEPKSRSGAKPQRKPSPALASVPEGAMAKPRKVQAKARKEREKKGFGALVRSGEEAELAANWGRAEKRYTEAIAVRNDPGIRLRLRAMRMLVVAGKLEREGKKAEAIALYREACLFSRNSPEIEERLLALGVPDGGLGAAASESEMP